MRQISKLFLLVFAGSLAACGGQSPAAQEPSPASSQAPAASEATQADSAQAEAPADSATAAATDQADADAEASAEAAEGADKPDLATQIAAATKRLEERYAKEAARWTDDVRRETKKITSRRYKNTTLGLRAAIAGPHRYPGHAERDVYRHPIETMKFFGLKPTHTVVEVGPGGGWYTELLAVVLAQKGQLVIPVYDPKSDDLITAYFGKSLGMLLDKSPELFGKVERVVNPRADGPLNMGSPGSADMVLVIRGMHNWHRNNSLTKYLANIHEVLKPGAVLGVVQHRAAATDNPDESANRGYLPEPWLISTIEAAGFKLSAKSDINANAKDTKDHPSGVWTLPPVLALKDKDKDKYLAIGESDRMTLRFVKTK